MVKTKAGLYELTADVSQSPLHNHDIGPTKVAQRTWTTYNIAALWIGMSVCIPTYMLAAGLVAGGMSAWQAVFTVMLGNVIVLIPMVLNAVPGTKYGIPFPVLVRSSFGTLGSNVPALLRAGVACGWFGIQTWIGGSALNAMMLALWSGWPSEGIGKWIAFFVFWAINVYIIVRGMETLKRFESWAAPILIVFGIAMLIWAMGKAGGLGPIMSEPSKFKNFGEFWKFFIPGLTGMVAFWATLSLNIPDFSRYARDQKAQIYGQALGLPTTMTLYAFIGVAVTSATVVIFGEALWDPVAVLSKFENPLVIVFGMFWLAVATLSTNIAANVVSPANDFQNLWPRKINFVIGGIITSIIGIVIMPWKLLSDYGAYIFNWLGTYGGLLGPIAGIMICDYYLIRKGKLDVHDLYVRGGEYEYSGGFNWKAIGAFVIGAGITLIGKWVDSVKWLADYSWFIGFAIGFVLYWVLMRGTEEVDLSLVPELDAVPEAE
ncbi:MAG: NCS1 family nucleobase:cation symporter-1 [Actinobacteria bacterium]|nr:NCS1 family nucleobase:cation symporter-1 [Actinomycetota bacterium]